MPISLPPWTDTPCKLHVIWSGKSPELTTQETCAYSPSSNISLPNVNGTILGGSKKLHMIHFQSLSSGFNLIWILSVSCYLYYLDYAEIKMRLVCNSN